MSKFLKVSILAILSVVLLAGTAMAGTMSVSSHSSGSAPITVALEAMGAARTFTIGIGTGGSFNTAGITITPAAPLLSSDTLTVTFANGAAFSGSSVTICSTNGTNSTQANFFLVAGPQPTTANATSANFRLATNAANGTVLFLTDEAGTTCTSTTGSVSVNFPATTSASVATVSFTDVSASGTFQADSSRAVNVANITPEYVTSYGVATSTIDFSNSAASNGTHFLTSGNAANGGNASINATAGNITAFGTPSGTNSTTASATNAGLTVSAVLSLQDSASWQGVKDVYASNGTSCALATNAAANNAPTGTVPLAIAGNSFNGAASYGFPSGSNAPVVCADVTGNAVLQARTIKASYTINVGTGGVSHAADPFATVMQWIPNGYTGVVAYINGSPTFNTICIISNQSSIAAPATFSVLTTESGASVAGLQGIQLGSVPAQGTIRVDINSSVTPYTYSGTTETAGTATALTGVQGNDRLTGQFTVGASPTSVTVNCIQADPAGSKRAVPVLVPNGTATSPYVY